MMINEVLSIRAKVQTETDVRRLRRWCVALLQDIGEMERKLGPSARPVEADEASDT
jgi:hypothetical protein